MIPPIDLRYIADEIDRLGEELAEAADEVSGGSDTDPRPLIALMNELLEALDRSQRLSEMNGDSAVSMDEETRDITALGDHGIDLLAQLAAMAGHLSLAQLSREIEGLALPLACWVARCDAEIVRLDPVVNGAAALANSLKQPRDLIQLYGLLREIGGAVSPQVSQEVATADPTRPWRVFLLNKAIVATRSHQPALMEEAFDALADQLPEEAPDFFREGMGQMDALDYPAEVRAVMERWYEQWCSKRVLH